MNSASLPEVSPGRAVSQPLAPNTAPLCFGCGVPLVGREIAAGICYVCVQEQAAEMAKFMAVGR